MAPELQIVPNDVSIMPYSNLKKNPTKVTEIHKYYNIVFEANPTKMYKQQQVITGYPTLHQQYISLCSRCQYQQDDQNHWYLCTNTTALQEQQSEIKQLQPYFKNIGLYPTLGH
jgi:hypothetical protein